MRRRESRLTNNALCKPIKAAWPVDTLDIRLDGHSAGFAIQLKYIGHKYTRTNLKQAWFRTTTATQHAFADLCSRYASTSRHLSPHVTNKAGQRARLALDSAYHTKDTCVWKPPEFEASSTAKARQPWLRALTALRGQRANRPRTQGRLTGKACSQNTKYLVHGPRKLHLCQA